MRNPWCTYTYVHLTKGVPGTRIQIQLKLSFVTDLGFFTGWSPDVLWSIGTT